MDNEEKIRILEAKVAELETKLNSLFSTSSFPLQLEDVLIRRGFYNLGERELTLYYSGGVGGNVFRSTHRLERFRNISSYGVIPYIVNTTDNTCYAPNHGFFDGRYISFLTTDPNVGLPAGLDSPITTYWVINATQDTFQVTTDGVNPVDITSTGTGDQYAYTY